MLPLIRGFWNEHRQTAGYEPSWTLDKAEKEFNRYIENEGSGIFVAKDSENKIVGFRSWELNNDFYFTRELYVIPEMRRKGIAKKLIKHFEVWLKEKGQDKACIWITPRNKAMIELARSLGYGVLNMIEICKPFEWREANPPGEAEALGKKWRIKEEKEKTERK